jgi:hypothetical protein
MNLSKSKEMKKSISLISNPQREEVIQRPEAVRADQRENLQKKKANGMPGKKKPHILIISE